MESGVSLQAFTPSEICSFFVTWFARRIYSVNEAKTIQDRVFHRCDSIVKSILITPGLKEGGYFFFFFFFLRTIYFYLEFCLRGFVQYRAARIAAGKTVQFNNFVFPVIQRSRTRKIFRVEPLNRNNASFVCMEHYSRPMTRRQAKLSHLFRVQGTREFRRRIL